MQFPVSSLEFIFLLSLNSSRVVEFNSGPHWSHLDEQSAKIILYYTYLFNIFIIIHNPANVWAYLYL